MNKNIADQEKRSWITPKLTKVSLVEATLGTGGTSCDGNGSLTQRGGGNDSDDPGLCDH